MVFGNISTLYLPIAANAGASMWATKVVKLLSAADATEDATTKTAHGTGSGQTIRTVAPYLSSSADVDESAFGWAVNPTDMGSVAGARRFYPAGNHTLTVDLINNTLTTSPTTITMFVYRVSSAAGGRTRTLLGSATSASQNVGSINAITFTVTVALPEIIFEVDETFQVGFEISANGLAVTGRVTTMRCGTSSTGTVARVDTPKLGVLADTTGAGAGSSTVTGVSGLVLGGDGAAAGVSTVAGVGGSRADTVGSAVGLSVVAGFGSSVAGADGVASGSAVVAGFGGLVLGTVGTVDIGGGCPVDWSPNDGAKAIAGTVLFHEPPNQGNPVDGATVLLIRDSDGLLVATTTTDALGAYSFPRDTNDPNTYHVEVRWTDGGTPQQGLSNEGCAPS